MHFNGKRVTQDCHEEPCGHQHDPKGTFQRIDRQMDSEPEDDEHKQHRGEQELEELAIRLQTAWRYGSGDTRNEKHVQDIRADDVSDDQFAVIASHRRDGRHQLRERRAEGDKGRRDDVFRYAYAFRHDTDGRNQDLGGDYDYRYCSDEFKERSECAFFGAVRFIDGFSV